MAGKKKNKDPMVMLLDFITVFCLVAGGLLLWLNIQHRSGEVILTKLDDDKL